VHLVGFIIKKFVTMHGHMNVKNVTFAHKIIISIYSPALQSALIRHTVQLFTESDDTRCCENTICPPEDGHVDARNMSRIVM